MNKPIIEVKHLTKVYNIGHEKKASAGTMTFRDSLTNVTRKPLEIITGHQLKKEKFLALNDVNLEVDQSDVVGIIGRNGSGKSTLLKVLSRIVEPTEGEVTMRGRVASLLEVGTGFHPELTGRENIYFNGAILGMTRKEIQRKFDEIVSFSEVEKFLDTPVKFYSSGMYVRLAFAVAAHLDPDILIVDEVLAVGDAAFQKKCLGKMKDVAGKGRTVLFVSHNMAAVQSLCNKGVVMDNGSPSYYGTIDQAIIKYSDQRLSQSGSFTVKKTQSEIGQSCSIEKIDLKNDKQLTTRFKSTDELLVTVHFHASENKFSKEVFQIDLNIINGNGEWILCASGVKELKDNIVILNLGTLELYRGIYSANISVLKGGILQQFVEHAFSFEVVDDDTMLQGVTGVVKRNL